MMPIINSFLVPQTDFLYMQKAQSLAQEALYITDPNPRVGCIIVKDNQIIGQGSTQKAGGPHAEVMALRDAKAHGHEQDIAGATFYVTLEPCSHFGRTPPCADALVAHKAGRVVVACLDPNPLVAGNGIKKLQQAGITVDYYPELAERTLALNPGFMSRMIVGKPWTWTKLACSLDGKLALNNGVSQWITSAEARADGQYWRARSSAVVTGVGTVLADNPLLNVRAFTVERQPLRVVIDGKFQVPVDAAIFNGAPVLVITHTQHPEKQAMLQDKGAEVLVVEEEGVLYKGAEALVVEEEGKPHKGIEALVVEEKRGQQAKNKYINLKYVWELLAQRGINEIHVEAGAGLNSALLQAGLIDELLVYMAPKIIGPGLDIFQMPALTDLSTVPTFEWVEQQRVGEDIRLRLRNPERWEELKRHLMGLSLLI